MRLTRCVSAIPVFTVPAADYTGWDRWAGVREMERHTAGGHPVVGIADRRVHQLTMTLASKLTAIPLLVSAEQRKMALLYL